MRCKSATLAAFGFAVTFLTPAPSFAALIDNSQLNISGDADVGAVFLNWHCNQPGDSACPTAPAGHGDFAVAGSTGSFAQYNGTFGLVADINNAAQPLNTLFSLPDFMTFDLNNNITIELTFIPIGTDPISDTCAGLTHCTPQNNLLITPANPGGLSAFNLDQNGTGTAATFGIFGTVHDITGDSASISGTYTAQFTGLDPEQVLALAENGSESSYSANLALTLVPEPTSMLLGGLGLLAIGLICRRKRV